MACLPVNPAQAKPSVQMYKILSNVKKLLFPALKLLAISAILFQFIHFFQFEMMFFFNKIK
jgi:hypothetical protein